MQILTRVFFQLRGPRSLSFTASDPHNPLLPSRPRRTSNCFSPLDRPLVCAWCAIRWTQPSPARPDERAASNFYPSVSLLSRLTLLARGSHALQSLRTFFAFYLPCLTLHTPLRSPRPEPRRHLFFAFLEAPHPQLTTGFPRHTSPRPQKEQGRHLEITNCNPAGGLAASAGRCRCPSRLNPPLSSARLPRHATNHIPSIRTAALSPPILTQHCLLAEALLFHPLP